LANENKKKLFQEKKDFEFIPSKNASVSCLLLQLDKHFGSNLLLLLLMLLLLLLMLMLMLLHFLCTTVFFQANLPDGKLIRANIFCKLHKI
jgi:hypothetical protein